MKVLKVIFTNRWFLMLLVLGVLIGMYLSSRPTFSSNEQLPADINFISRCLIVTGSIGGGYYLYDTDGTGYKVSQQVFDSYSNLPIN